MENTVKNINTLGAFLGMRDIAELTSECLKEKYGIAQADVMVLFGGSIMCGGDVMAEAMKNGIAKKYIIVGGEGHTTETLRVKVHGEIPDVGTAGLPEARVFAGYLKHRYGLEADYLEEKSTNCGNNITYLLDLLREKDVSFGSIIICQDASMQRRMDAGLRKYTEGDIQIINYAAYSAKVVARNNALVYEKDIRGMWSIERYVSLLLGEIPRLTDDKNGYGPNGNNFIAHVDIPEEVRAAFDALKSQYAELVREANPAYASK